jgi:hypothetical protein
MLLITYTDYWIEPVMSFSCSSLVLWKITENSCNNVNYSCYIRPRKVVMQTDTRVLMVTGNCKVVWSFKDKS